MSEGGEWRSARAALEAGDRHMIGPRFGNARGDGAHADLRDQLHRDAGFGIDVLQIVDELGQILDRIDVVGAAAAR